MTKLQDLIKKDGTFDAPVPREWINALSDEDVKSMTLTNWKHWIGFGRLLSPNAYPWKMECLNLLLERKGIWETELGTWFHKKGHRHRALNIPDHPEWWINALPFWPSGWRKLFTAPDPFEVLFKDLPSNLEPTSLSNSNDLGPSKKPKMEQVQAKDWVMRRHLCGFESNLTSSTPNAFDWLWAFVESENWASVKDLLDKGVRWSGSKEKEAQKRLHEDHARVQKIYSALVGQGATSPRYPEEYPIKNWDETLFHQWKTLLNAGIPMVSSLGISVQSSVLVAKLEATLGGMTSKKSMYDWIDIGPMFCADPRTPTLNMWEWAKSMEVDFSNLSFESASEWLSKKKDQASPEKVLSELPLHFEKFPLKQEHREVTKGPTHPPTSHRYQRRRCLIEEALRSRTSIKTIQSLVEMGAQLHYPFESGRSVLAFIFTMTKTQERPILFEMCKKHLGLHTKSVINMQDKEGQSALHYAIHVLSPEDLRWFIDQGADFSLKDSKGCTPLHRLAYSTTQGLIQTKRSDQLSILDTWTLLIETSQIDWTLKNNEGQTAMSVLSAHPEVYSDIEKIWLEKSIRTSSNPTPNSRNRL